MDSFQLKRRAVVRWLVLLCMVVGGWFFSAGAAFAANNCSTNWQIGNDNCDTREQAYAAAMAAADGRCVYYYGAANCAASTINEIPWDGTKGGYEGCATSKAGGQNCFNRRYYFQDCPAGTSWDGASGTCVSQCPNGWADPLNPGQCLDADKCLARNAEIGANAGLARPSLTTSRCVAGCNFAMDTTSPDYSVTKSSISGGAQATVYRGVMEYTGDPCTGGAPSEDIEEPKKDLKQECTPVGGQTVCRKPNGQECYTAGSTGNQICWNPGETGDKTDGPILQKRQPGQPTPPNSVDLPNGDTATKTGDSINTSTTVINNGGNSTVISTTTTNYQTGSGANAGGTNQGEPGDGTGDKTQDGNDETGSPSYDCTHAPVCSSTDSIGCAMLRQTWANHCDFAEDYVGDDPTSLDGEGAIETDGDLFRDEPGPDEIFGSLPSGGWAGRGACPIDFSFSVFGRTYNVSASQLCDLLDALASLVLVAAAVMAGKIIGGGYR